MYKRQEWQTFAWVIPIVIKVGVGLELENTLEIDWENGLKVNDRVESVSYTHLPILTLLNSHADRHSMLVIAFKSIGNAVL